MEPSPKRLRTDQGANINYSQIASASAREISPPLTRKRSSVHDSHRDASPFVFESVAIGKKAAGVVHEHAEKRKTSTVTMNTDAPLLPFPPEPISLLPSPIHLTRVDGLSHENNIDCLSLGDLIGDPLIKECWAFNYLFDIDFLLSKFDEDVRSTVQVKLVHGFWKTEDANQAYLNDAASRHSNVEHVAAYLPEMFGTHHSKMFILIRHDDQAQVIIHTANLIPRDWRMCQAVWRSPLLPLNEDTRLSSEALIMGSGGRFKFDLMSYLKAYERNHKPLLKNLIDQVAGYDFSAIHAAFVASVPGRQSLVEGGFESESPPKTTWGWPGLKRVLRHVPSSLAEESQIIMQVSSIATLGATDKWLKGAFLPSLSARKFESSPTNTAKGKKPRFSLIFPTADEIRRSLDGYGSGGSIHCKTQGNTQEKQLQYLRPYLCHWAGDHASTSGSTSTGIDQSVHEAGRRRAAPHIKTYMRFSDPGMTKLDWAMVTSANLSKQAWGAEANAAGEVRVCSYEVGVVVWPDLFGAKNERIEMIPVFKKDSPTENDFAAESAKKAIGLRMPYDLPLVPYAKAELPWCASASDAELDWMGRAWPGFGTH